MLYAPIYAVDKYSGKILRHMVATAATKNYKSRYNMKHEILKTTAHAPLPPMKKLHKNVLAVGRE